MTTSLRMSSLSARTSMDRYVVKIVQTSEKVEIKFELGGGDECV